MTRRASGRSALWWGVASSLVLLLVALAIPAVASAHAELDHADPPVGARLQQPPTRLSLSFTEAVDPSFSQIQVLDDQSQQVDNGDSRVASDDPRTMLVTLPGGLPDGIYTVSWRTLSAVDGHTVNGAYPLLVGNVSATAAPAAATSASTRANFSNSTAVGRWWFYICASIVFGALVAWKYVFSAILKGANMAGRVPGAQRTRTLVIVAGGLLVVATLYGALAQASAASNAPLWGVFGAPLETLLTRGRFAVIWWPRLLLVTIALLLVVWQGVDGWAGEMAMAIMPGVLLTSSLTSHGAALASGPYLGIAVDWLHLGAAAIWIGGLASLVFVLPVVLHTDARLGDRVHGRTVRRFSSLAIGSVIVIVATGVFQTWLEVGSWEALAQTAYGQSILTKIGLLAIMLVFGAYNLLVAGPRLSALAGKGSGLARAVAQRFRLSVRIELGVGLLVLGVAAMLTGLNPGREELANRSPDVTQPGPVDRTIDAQGLSARIQISPASLGVNDFAVQLPGTDPSTVERVQLNLTFLDAELGSQPLVLQLADGSSPPTWQAETPALSQAGQWQAELLVRRTGQDDARNALRFVVTGPGAQPVASSSGVASYPLLPSPLTTLAYVLLGAGVGVVVVAFVKGGRRVHRTQAALLGAGLVIMLCGGYVYAQDQMNGVPVDVTNIRNPVPPDERSLAAGQQIYADNCAACHGDTGRGDGPAGIRLVPRPADLRVHMAAGHTDGQLFYWVSYGFPGTAMPAWRDQLSEQQRWDVINYIRTFANSP
ncbi:MAG: CopD family protein [Chloroflexi bacterium]|nr:CopD family protein [Chloroflexota bacterium]